MYFFKALVSVTGLSCQRPQAWVKQPGLLARGPPAQEKPRPIPQRRLLAWLRQLRLRLVCCQLHRKPWLPVLRYRP